MASKLQTATIDVNPISDPREGGLESDTYQSTVVFSGITKPEGYDGYTLQYYYCHFEDAKCTDSKKEHLVQKALRQQMKKQR